MPPKTALAFGAGLGLAAASSLGLAQAREIIIERLSANIDPANVGKLDGLWCANVDKIVKISIGVDWPPDKTDVETDGYKRLIFWDDQDEHLFPDGSYSYQHGTYVIDGYFIARSGGIHQGVSSLYFERVDDAQVLLNPAVKEVPAKETACK